MGASVNHDFRRGFILDEERIRKVNDIIKNRLHDIEGSPVPSYKVYRADSFVYTTLDIQDIINEENLEWQRIEHLTISIDYPNELTDEAKSNSKLELLLHFHRPKLRSSTSVFADDDFHSPSTLLVINGEDRDRVYILFSDLREYLSNEVNILRTPQGKLGGWLRRFSILLPLFAMLLLMIYPVFIGPSPEERARALNSQDLNEKVNFLIAATERQSLANFRPGLWLVISAFLIFVFSMMFEARIARFGNRLFAESSFLFGREIERNRRKQELRSKILWGVIIASIVSFVTGFLLWILTTNK